MKEKYLILDCDGVIFDSLELIDQQVRKIEYKASDEYYRYLLSETEKAHERLHVWEEERSNDLDEHDSIICEIGYYTHLRKEHFKMKDLVLEEALPQYKNLIDYDKVYRLENTYHGVVELIKHIWKNGEYDKIYVLSHVNSPREVKAKRAFFDKYLPMVNLVFPMFHFESFFNRDGSINITRKRSNKLEYLMSVETIDDLSNSTFIDDTESIITEAIKLGVGFSYHKSKTADSFYTILQAYDEFCDSLNNGKVKKKEF